MATALIKNGTIITATDHYKGDVLVEDEIVKMLGTEITFPKGQGADVVIDATDKYVIPGGIDVHTHLNMSFGGASCADDFEQLENFETGTIAAACGGTTSLVDCAIQEPGHSLRHGWDAWMAKADGKAAVDYGFHMIMREFNQDLGKEMGAMVNEGVSSFQLFMAGVFLMNDADIFRAMQRSGEVGATICIHAENGSVIDVLVEQALKAGKAGPEYHAMARPARAEAEATHRAIAMAEIADVPVYIVHLSSAEALEKVQEARNRGVAAYAETCPQYLFLDFENYLEPDCGGSKYVMSPPLRAKEKQDDLWTGLRNNDLQLVATDHSSFCLEQKLLGEGDFSKIPNGAPGLETRVSLMYDGGVRTGRISLNRWVEVLSTAPAKIFGMFPKKGTIAPGSDADIVVFDPEKKKKISSKTLHMNSDFNPYEGRDVVGWTETVLSRGTVVVRDGEFVGHAGTGQYIRRSPRSAEL